MVPQENFNFPLLWFNLIRVNGSCFQKLFNSWNETEVFVHAIIFFYSYNWNLSYSVFMLWVHVSLRIFTVSCIVIVYLWPNSSNILLVFQLVILILSLFNCLSLFSDLNNCFLNFLFQLYTIISIVNGFRNASLHEMIR